MGSKGYPIVPSKRNFLTLGLQSISYCYETQMRMNVVPLLLLPPFRTHLPDTLSMWESKFSSQACHASSKLVGFKHVELTLTETVGVPGYAVEGDPILWESLRWVGQLSYCEL